MMALYSYKLEFTELDYDLLLQRLAYILYPGISLLHQVEFSKSPNRAQQSARGRA